MDKPYKRLPVSGDFSYTTVVECLRHMVPADRYDIVAGRAAYWNIKTILSVEWHHPNPFTPQLNVYHDHTLGEREWYINPIRYAEAGHRNVDCWGSEGV